MSPQSRPVCQVCTEVESRYTCPKCAAVYCSVPCFRIHADTCRPEKYVTTPNDVSVQSAHTNANEDVPRPEHSLQPDAPQIHQLDQTTPLRPLTELKWPYVPEESAFPDPLKRDDPKPLQLRHYEAIATSPGIRNAFRSHPQLPALLTSIDRLRGPDRDLALQRALGVTEPDLQEQARGHVELGEDVIATRELAEAVEAAVRGGKEGALGLDWRE